IDTELEWFFNLASRVEAGEQRNNYLAHLGVLTEQIELIKMSKLSFDSAIRMLPEFAGLPSQDLNLFEKKCEFVFKHIEDAIVNDVLEALLCNLSGKALCITQHKTITNYKDLITVLRANFGNNFSETYLSKQLNSITQAKFEKVQDYAGRVELALYRLINEMTKDKSTTESKTISKVLTTQAQNIFVDGLYFQIRTVLRAMKLGSLEEMIKAALEEEQALENLKPKFDKPNTSTFSKPKCFNCEGYGHLSRECKKPKIKECRKLKYNNEQKSKISEGSSSSATIKTIGDIKNSSILMLKRGTNKEIKIESSALMGKGYMFLIDTGADLNIIKLAAIKNNVPVEATSTTLIGINENSIKTLGIIKINLIIDKNNYFDTVFHVVDDKFPGSMTGILGIPFFSDNDVTLNLRKGEMIIDRQQNKENMISLPPRSNNVLTISVSNENINNGDS
ncbi:hypothetical protein AGLY_017631, partial [Aphis glycines]